MPALRAAPPAAGTVGVRWAGEGHFHPAGRFDPAGGFALCAVVLLLLLLLLMFVCCVCVCVWAASSQVTACRRFAPPRLRRGLWG
jgi:hypothetical protein